MKSTSESRFSARQPLVDQLAKLHFSSTALEIANMAVARGPLFLKLFARSIER